MKNFEITWADFPGPCYDPQERHGDCPTTFLQLMKRDNIPAKDLIWAFSVCPKISDSDKRRFAVRCVRETPIGNGRFVADLLTDEQSIAALDVAMRHADGRATDKELAAASEAASEVWAARAASEASEASEVWAARAASEASEAWAAAWAAALAAASEASEARAARAASEAAQVEIIKSMIKE